jgi:hypothetical protein
LAAIGRAVFGFAASFLILTRPFYKPFAALHPSPTRIPTLYVWELEFIFRGYWIEMFICPGSAFIREKRHRPTKPYPATLILVENKGKLYTRCLRFSLCGRGSGESRPFFRG